MGWFLQTMRIKTWKSWCNFFLSFSHCQYLPPVLTAVISEIYFDLRGLRYHHTDFVRCKISLRFTLEVYQGILHVQKTKINLCFERIPSSQWCDCLYINITWKMQTLSVLTAICVWHLDITPNWEKRSACKFNIDY